MSELGMLYDVLKNLSIYHTQRKQQNSSPSILTTVLKKLKDAQVGELYVYICCDNI